MDTALSVLIVSAHRLLRECLAASLAPEGEVTVLGAVASPEEAVERCLSCSPQILLVDAALPHGAAIELTRCVQRLSLDTRVAILGLPEEQELVVNAMEVGAHAYVGREAGLPELKCTLRALADGGDLDPPRVAYRLFERVSELAGAVGRRPAVGRERWPVLTRREEEILALVADGLSNKEIARQLYLSLATVKNHVHNILDKLGVSGRWAAAAYLRDQGRRPPVLLGAAGAYSA